MNTMFNLSLYYQVSMEVLTPQSASVYIQGDGYRWVGVGVLASNKLLLIPL